VTTIANAQVTQLDTVAIIQEPQFHLSVPVHLDSVEMIVEPPSYVVMPLVDQIENAIIKDYVIVLLDYLEIVVMQLKNV